MKREELIIEKEAGHFWGRIEGKGVMPTGQGTTINQLIDNVKDSILDYHQPGERRGGVSLRKKEIIL